MHHVCSNVWACTQHTQCIKNRDKENEGIGSKKKKTFPIDKDAYNNVHIYSFRYNLQYIPKRKKQFL